MEEEFRKQSGNQERGPFDKEVGALFWESVEVEALGFFLDPWLFLDLKEPVF